MQEIGLGVNRNKFKFTHLSLNGKVVEPKFLLSNAPETLNFYARFYTAGDYEISLQTPLRIKQKTFSFAAISILNPSSAKLP